MGGCRRCDGEQRGKETFFPHQSPLFRLTSVPPALIAIPPLMVAVECKTPCLRHCSAGTRPCDAIVMRFAAPVVVGLCSSGRNVPELRSENGLHFKNLPAIWLRMPG